MKVKDLQPGMKVRSGRSYWRVEANFGWRTVLHTVGRYPLEAWVIMYTKAADDIFMMWSYRNPNDEVEVFEERVYEENGVSVTEERRLTDLRQTTDDWMENI